MVPILDAQRTAIAEICRRHGVLRLDVFGSALRDDFRPGESDLDFLVELAPMESYARVDAYFGLLDDLRALFGPRIDLVMVGGQESVHRRSHREHEADALCRGGSGAVSPPGRPGHLSPSARPAAGSPVSSLLRTEEVSSRL
jgi:uncharacterized protein